MFDKNIKLLASFLYGSSNYGTVTDNSDIDFIYIVPDDVPYENGQQFHVDDEKNGVDETIYLHSKFIERIREHKIDALECIFSINLTPIVDYKEFFTLDLHKLRESISSTCSNSWVKAKKKMTVEKDYDIYKGKKSLFHSIRIYDFGCQIAQYGRIVDFSSCDELWTKIYNDESTDYFHYQKLYKPMYNKYHSKFVTLAPKNT